MYQWISRTPIMIMIAMVSGNGFHEIQIYPQPFPGAKLKGINRLFVMLAAGLLVLSHSK
jgi:hypothetical protein